MFHIFKSNLFSWNLLVEACQYSLSINFEGLVKKNLIPAFWLHKPKIEAPVNLTGAGKMLAVNINGVPASAILDTGLTYTLIHFLLWLKLKLNSNLLDTTILYNINSASHKNPNAVLGSLNLTLAITAETGED